VITHPTTGKIFIHKNIHTGLCRALQNIFHNLITAKISNKEQQQTNTNKIYIYIQNRGKDFMQFSKK